MLALALSESVIFNVCYELSDPVIRLNHVKEEGVYAEMEELAANLCRNRPISVTRSFDSISVGNPDKLNATK